MPRLGNLLQKTTAVVSNQYNILLYYYLNVTLLLTRYYQKYCCFSTFFFCRICLASTDYGIIVLIGTVILFYNLLITIWATFVLYKQQEIPKMLQQAVIIIPIYYTCRYNILSYYTKLLNIKIIIIIINNDWRFIIFSITTH